MTRCNVLGSGIAAVALALSACAVSGELEDDRYDNTDLGKGDSWSPSAAEALENPEIIISLDQLTLHVFDREAGVSEVFPVGVGVINRDGLSITPTGHYHTHQDITDGWYYMARRTNPSYFGGFPFIRYDCPNPDGYHTYGMHGPITRELIRGYVSHGCTRMDGADAQRVFELIHRHPSTQVTVQREPEIDADGNVVDVDTEVALFAPGAAIPYGDSVGDPPPYDDTGTDDRGCSDDRLEPGEIADGFVRIDGPGEIPGLLLCSRDEQDRFTIDLEAGQQAFVEIDGFNPVVSNLDLRAVDPDGAPLSASENTIEPEEALAFTAPRSGTYSIEIYRGPDLVEGAQTNGYALRVEVQ